MSWPIETSICARIAKISQKEPEMQLSGLLKTQYKLMDFALINHRVPAHRLRRSFPEAIRPETFHFEDTNEEMGLISVACARYKEFRPSLYPGNGIEFWEISYRSYGNFKGLPCVYLFASEYDTWPSFIANRLGKGHSFKSDMLVTINRSPSGSYELYEANLKSDQGNLQFAISAKGQSHKRHPFLSGADMESFFFDRYHQMEITTAGFIGDIILSHHKVKKMWGNVSIFQCGFWVKKGLLKEEESDSLFHSCLVSPAAKVFAYPIVPAAFVAGSA